MKDLSKTGPMLEESKNWCSMFQDESTIYLDDEEDGWICISASD